MPHRQVLVQYLAVLQVQPLVAPCSEVRPVSDHHSNHQQALYLEHHLSVEVAVVSLKPQMQPHHRPLLAVVSHKPLQMHLDLEQRQRSDLRYV